MALECPQSSTLDALLAGTLSEGQDAALWSHLEECEDCQAEMDRLSDDPELKSWRPACPIESEKVRDASSLCQAMVERLVRGDTSIDRPEDKGTTLDHPTESEFPSRLSQSRWADDLGMLYDYRIRQKLGEGGMAVVFDALDTQLNRIVAIKILKPEQGDARSKERFVREAQAIAALHHPHVVAIHSIGKTPEGLPFFAMEKMQGGCLTQRIRQADKISPRQAASWIADVADGLAAAHEAGLIHRDVKPSNVLLSDDGQTAKLADFGLARHQSVSVEFTHSGVLLGTPAYMSPEHVETPQAADARSDIYGLGVTLYETLTGEVPFRGALHTLLQRIQSEEPAWPRTLDPSIPRDLETICMKAMHRQPARRYATALDFASDLRRWLRGEPIVARPVTRVERCLRWCARNPGITSLAATIATLLLVLAVGSTYSAFSIRSAAKALRTERDNLSSANQQIQLAADDAAQHRQIAIEALNSLVTKVQAELSLRPGTIKLRQAILETALAGLDQITEHAGSAASRHTTIEAHLRKSEILDLLGQTARAAEEIDKAELLAEAASQASPHDPQALADLGNALMARADAHRKAFAYEPAQAIFERLLPLRETVARALPEDRTANRALAFCLQRLADLQYHRSDWSNAEAGYQRLLSYQLTSLQLFPDDLAIQRDLSIAYERLATLATTVGRADTAMNNFNEAIAINQSLLDRDPDNKQSKADHAYFTKRLASLYSLRGDHDIAARFAHNAIECYMEVADSDPLDTDARTKVAAGWDTLYAVRLAAEDLAQAADAAREAARLFDGLQQAYPDTTKYAVLAAEAYTKLTDAQIRLGQQTEAAISIRDQIRSFDLGQLAKDAFAGQFDAQKASSAALLAALELVLRGVDDIDQQQVPVDLRYVAKTLAMYEYARTGKIDRALELGDQLVQQTPSNPDMALIGQFVGYRAFGLCFLHITAEPNQIETPVDPRIARAVDGCAKTAQQLLTRAPAMRDFLWNESDVRAIRQQEPVRALFPQG